MKIYYLLANNVDVQKIMIQFVDITIELIRIIAKLNVREWRLWELENVEDLITLVIVLIL